MPVKITIPEMQHSWCVRCGNDRGETWHGAQTQFLRHHNQAEFCATVMGLGEEGANRRKREKLSYWGRQGRLCKQQFRLVSGQDAEEQRAWQGRLVQQLEAAALKDWCIKLHDVSCDIWVLKSSDARAKCIYKNIKLILKGKLKILKVNIKAASLLSLLWFSANLMKSEAYGFF